MVMGLLFSFLSITGPIVSSSKHLIVSKIHGYRKIPQVEIHYRMQICELMGTNQSGLGIKIPLKEKTVSIDIHFGVSKYSLKSIKQQL